MLFGVNLGGGNLPHESRAEALEGRLEKSRLAKRYGFHSLWSGAGYLNNDFHPMLLLSRAAAEAPPNDSHASVSQEKKPLRVVIPPSSTGTIRSGPGLIAGGAGVVWTII